MITNAKVRFETEDTSLQEPMDTAQEKCKMNIKDFAGRDVLIEGGGYEKIWLETQPMGGEMYGKRNLKVGLNNQLLFMEHIREDGRIPGSIAILDGKLTPQYNKLQGFCFPTPALNMYYLAELGDDYLDLLYNTLERFDHYLWNVRDSDQDGCLESWCKYDTGEDHALRYGYSPDDWSKEVPPDNCSVVPMASMDIMSFSYSAREVLADICRIWNKEGLEQKWRAQAKDVQIKIRSYLWCEQHGACFDRDKYHRKMPVLIHNTLRAMYWNSITKDMAQRFVEEHLLNPNEFWTKMPLPSVAVNDPLFRNITTNNWSGQVEMLTYQRAIRALENYGYDYLIPELGRKLFMAIGEECIFVQQFDPFTGIPSKVCLDGEQDAYGPAMLSVMEYTARMYGIHKERNQIFWGCTEGKDCVYVQEWGDDCYRLEHIGKNVVGSINGKTIFSREQGGKIITDKMGVRLEDWKII